MASFGNFHNVTGAGWSVYWKIPIASGGGLELWWADFQGHRVMWRGSQPFALVPYHGGSPTYKDGFDAKCGGAAFTALKHTAPNAWVTDPAQFAAVDTDAVVVQNEPADDFDPARPHHLREIPMWLVSVCAQLGVRQRWCHYPTCFHGWSPPSWKA